MAEPATRILIVEDSADDYELLVHELRRSDLPCRVERVESESGLRSALVAEWDIIVSDHVLPRLDSFAALKISRQAFPDIPFIVVSGRVGEEVVVEVMKAGANDCLLKENLLRFAPAVRRELEEARLRRRGRQAEEQLRQAQKMEALGQLTGGIAHDFNNLLTVIIGNIEMLGLDLEEDNPLIQGAIDAGRRGSELTQRLLAFSRRSPITPRTLELGTLLEGLLVLLRRTLGDAIELELRLAKALWCIEMDIGQLEHAIINLAVNARDAMPQGGTLTLECSNIVFDQERTPGGPASGEYVLVSVSDTGTGMSDAVRQKAFEPFYTTKEIGRGTGLGLSMVSGFIGQSGGHVTIDSVVGEGTRVDLYLPKSGNLLAAIESETNEDAPTGRGEHVLVLEDDPNVRATVVTMLTRLGYVALEAHDAAAGRASLQRDPKIQLVVSDITLPGGVSGLQFADESRDRNPELKVIFMSGFTEETAHLTKSMDSGVVWLQKPFESRVLARAIRKELE